MSVETELLEPVSFRSTAIEILEMMRAALGESFDPAVGKRPRLRRCRPLALAVAVLAAGCGGSGGGSGFTVVPEPPPDPPPAPIALADAIPAAGVTIDPATHAIHVIHVSDSDWRFEYDGTCEPTGVALRHVLDELGGTDDGREVVDHKLTCTLAPGEDHEVRVDATAGNGARHRAVLEFSSSAASAATGVRVDATTRHMRGAVDGLFGRYVRESMLEEVDTPLIGTLVALLVGQIARQRWTELGVRGSTWGTVSEAVSYASRSPSGAAATLSGLVSMPDVGAAADYTAPGRIVVLAHATGATPSRLSPDDGWYVLANLLAGRGYLVVAPDNWGRGHTSGEDAPETYLMANRTAANGLDMVLAVLDDARYDVFHDTSEPVEVAIIGYSQGAHSAVALWLAGAPVADSFVIREVYAGGGPHDLYRTFRGALEGIDDRCDGNPWCRAVDRKAIEPYATGRIMPAFLRYTDVGVTRDDVFDGERLSETFVTGMLDDEERFDALKTMLQLNSFTNLVDLAGTMSDADTRILLYHSAFDRLVPPQNTADLAAALVSGFDATANLDTCGSGTFEQLGKLLRVAGMVHAICAFEMFDRVLRDLRESEAARTGYDHPAGRRLDPALPWRALAERQAAAALEDADGLAAFRSAKSGTELRTLSRRLRAADSPAVRELADRLWIEPR